MDSNFYRLSHLDSDIFERKKMDLGTDIWIQGHESIFKVRIPVSRAVVSY